MKNSWLVVALVAMVMMSCKKGKEEAPETDDTNSAAPAAGDPPSAAKPAEPAVDSPPTTAGGPPTAAALVKLKVADFDEWKKVFDETRAARVAGGIVGHHINRSADDGNALSIYLPVVDPARFDAFIKGEELKSTMQRAGVQGPPTVVMMKPMLRENVVFDEPMAGMIVIHEVKDYEAWLAVYNEFDAKRQEMGITGHAVNQLADNPNKVVVYHQADDLETLKKFASSKELKSAMGKAGVTGRPEISFHEAGGGGMY